MPGSAADGEQIVEDSALDLQHWEKEDGTSVIPFFTSLEALQQAVEDEQAFVMMPARTLMAMTLGESLFLNPKLPSGKEFTRGKSAICWVKRAVRSVPRRYWKAVKRCCCLKSPNRRRRWWIR